MVLSVILLILATFYVTYVVTQSDFPPIAFVRDHIIERWGLDGWLGYLSTCAWCASVYISAIFVIGTNQVTDIHLPLLVWLSAAGVTGILMEIINDE